MKPLIHSTVSDYNMLIIYRNVHCEYVVLCFSKHRPWLIDDFDQWIERIDPSRKPHRCVVIFCDNSGADIILGVIPFALDFLNRGSKVILAANSSEFISIHCLAYLVFCT